MHFSVLRFGIPQKMYSPAVFFASSSPLPLVMLLLTSCHGLGFFLMHLKVGSDDISFEGFCDLLGLGDRPIRVSSQTSEEESTALAWVRWNKDGGVSCKSFCVH